MGASLRREQGSDWYWSLTPYWRVTLLAAILSLTNSLALSIYLSPSQLTIRSPNWVHSARRPLNGLLYLPRVIVMMENLVKWRLTGETEVLGENLPQRHFVHHKYHPGRRSGKPTTKCLSYGAASQLTNLLEFILKLWSRFREIRYFRFRGASEGSLLLELECSDLPRTGLWWMNSWISNMNKICQNV
jgi:hypothetical protein